jgi:hypothetical protein
MILVFADPFLSDFPPIASLLSPGDSAASFKLSSVTAKKLPPANKLSPFLSPDIKLAMDQYIKLAMDPDGCPPCVAEHMSPLASRLAPPNRMPLSPLFQLDSNII